MNWFVAVGRFYYEGFKSMKLGKTLWLIILIKLVVFFGIMRLIFFPNYLNTRFETDQEKASYVGKELVQRSDVEEAP